MTEPADAPAPADAAPSTVEADRPASTTPASGRHVKDKESHNSFLRELPILIAVALVLALLIKAFLVQAFYIPSESMLDTLHIGDRVLVNKLVYHTRSIHRGEIVVFNGKGTNFENTPEVTSSTPRNVIARFFRSIGSAIGIAPPGEKDFIKRVIGVGGDHVVCCDTLHRITVNGVPLNETYLKPGVNPSDTAFDKVIPKGDLWVMGDNRSNSQDSRANGPIPSGKVIGRAFIKVWPFSHFGVLRVPKTFSQKALHMIGVPLGGDPSLALGLLGAVPVLRIRRRWQARRRAGRPVVP